jgi:protein-tyrosine phosphatase
MDLAHLRHHRHVGDETDTRFRVLSVCVGNICRSPVSEFLLRHELGSLVDSSSAGTRALVGDPIHPPMAAMLDELDVTHEGAARQVTASILGNADLVLTMTREIRSQVVELAPAKVRRTFTLAEFAAIVGAGRRPQRAPRKRSELLELIAAATAQRSAVAQRGADLDIADPYRRGAADYTRAFGEIRACVSAIVTAWA